ncbi:hypothetical protein T439DRAFT_330449 [Meredithblackwellia eburnea MCA 4105]
MEEAPPPYDFTDGTPATASKLTEKQRLQARQQAEDDDEDEQPQASTSSSSAIVGRSLEDGGAPTSFHVYKAPGMFNKDDIITHDDKQVVQYHLSFPRTWGGWDLSLHRGSKDGPLVARIDKGSWSSEMRISMRDGWTTTLYKSSIFKWNFKFGGMGGRTVYKWKSDGMFNSGYTCFNTTNNDIIATWRSTTFALSKDGQLLVSKHYLGETELILTTALALEEWAREQRQRSRRHGGGGGP